MFAVSVFSATAGAPLLFPKRSTILSACNETSGQRSLIGEESISFYDPNCQQETGIGLTSGGTFEGAIRITPSELARYQGWNLIAAQVFISNDDGSEHRGNLKIYEQGSPIHPGILLSSEPYTITERGWVRVNLSEEIALNSTKDIWVSFEITHAAGEHPLIAVEGPATDGKSDWVANNGSWLELQSMDSTFDLTWIIEAIVARIGPSRTELQIETISGGFFGVRTTIENIGDSEAINTTVGITVNGGLLVFINKNSLTLTPGLAAGASVGSCVRVFGLGKIMITVKVEAVNADPRVKSATGFVLGPLVLGIK
jgi:hypothetical protein